MDESKMKKKLLFGILLLSLFLLSSATVVQPVRGYDYDLPSEAIGYTVTDEVRLFDEDEWEDHLGKGCDPTDITEGDSDVVGAQSQYTILEFEKDEDLINYLEDFVMVVAGVDVIHDGMVSLIQSLAINLTVMPADTYGPLAFLANYSLTQVNAGPYTGLVSGAQALAVPATNKMLAPFDLFVPIMDKYSNEYDGAILTRDFWEYTDEAFDEDPDTEDDEVPFFFDPRDWKATFDDLQNYGNDVYGNIDAIQDNWGDNGVGPLVTGCGWYIALIATAYGASPPNGVWLGYEAVNATIKAQVDLMKDPAMKATVMALAASVVPSDPLGIVTSGALNRWYNYSDYVLACWAVTSGILETIRETLEAMGQDKAGYLLRQLVAGQPPSDPAGDFLKKVVEEYNHDEDDLVKIPFIHYGRDLNLDGEISDMPLGLKDRFTGGDLGGETIYVHGYIDYEVTDDGVITAEIEYQDGQIDPKDDLRWLKYGFDVDGEDELEDFEIVFGDENIWKDGDTQFWVKGTIEEIPGFEVTVILGASAIAIMGLIYVVMKKRKK